MTSVCSLDWKRLVAMVTRQPAAAVDWRATAMEVDGAMSPNQAQQDVLDRMLACRVQYLDSV
jgi:hypothetical protein